MVLLKVTETKTIIHTLDRDEWYGLITVTHFFYTLFNFSLCRKNVSFKFSTDMSLTK